MRQPNQVLLAPTSSLMLPISNAVLNDSKLAT